MFKSKNVFPMNAPGWAIAQSGYLLQLWVSRREDEIRMTLWKRLFG